MIPMEDIDFVLLDMDGTLLDKYFRRLFLGAPRAREIRGEAQHHLREGERGVDEEIQSP